MVRGLQARRLFVGLNVALGVLLAATGVTVVSGMRAKAPAAVPAPEALPEDAVVTAYLPPVEARSAYDALVQSGIFGEAGRWNPNAAPPPEPPKPVETEITESELTELRLVGTLALAPGVPEAAAFIENVSEQKGAKGYSIGEPVLEKVTLLEVFPRRVILLNETTGAPKKEYLSMDDKKEGESESPSNKMAGGTPPGHRNSNRFGPPSHAKAAPKPAASKASAANAGGNVKLKTREFQKDLMDNYKTLLAVKPIEKRDAQGKLMGLTADNISQYPLASKLGLRDGDILQSINGEPIQNEQQILEIVQKYQGDRSFRIGIMRDGRLQTLNYDLE